MLLQMLSQMPADLTKSELTEYIKSGNKSIKRGKANERIFHTKRYIGDKTKKKKQKNIYSFNLFFLSVDDSRAQRLLNT